MIKRIALVGKSGAGKSTAARIISDVYGLQRVSTGSICRQISRILFGDEDKASTQKIDDALLEIDGSIFLKAALREIPEAEMICVDSLRFASDLDIARNLGLFVIRVVASDEVRANRLVNRGQPFRVEIDGRHRSETELDECIVDHVLVNDGDQSLLQAAIAEIGIAGT